MIRAIWDMIGPHSTSYAASFIRGVFVGLAIVAITWAVL